MYFAGPETMKMLLLGLFFSRQDAKVQRIQRYLFLAFFAALREVFPSFTVTQ
jgi:hypothetical protein